MISLPVIVELVTMGMVLAAIYALMAIGITLIYGIMKVSNFAHGEYYMIGAYAAYYTVKFLNVPTALSIPPAIGAGFALGYIVERLIIRDTYAKKIERPGEYAMLATLALSILLQNIAREVFGPFMRSTPPLMPGRVMLYLITLSLDRIIALVISIVTLVALYYFIRRTKTGRAWRAVAQNKVGALVTGINPEKACRLSYGIGGALAALAGGLLAPVYAIYPNMGFWPLIISFVAMTLGGLGSIEGSLIAAVIIGLTHVFAATFIGPSYADVAMYAVLIITVVIRPTGLLGRRD